MTEHADVAAGDARPNLPEFTVSQLSGAVKRTIEDAFGYVRVRGEISRPSYPTSGHCYLKLKDDSAVLDAVIWRSALSRIGVRPEEGLEVIATGKMTTYQGKSSYQLTIDRLEVAGEGALLKLLEDRRRRLAEEGLFDDSRKRPVPFLPEVIGVVTSPTGAVIRDILHRIADRFPRTVLVWPVRVQGEGAAEEIAAAIRGFNALTHDGEAVRPDVIIVARGGGSLEDLWAFNEEIVVRAAAHSEIPLISAVGHETDTTLIDFASDRRAPTPTAAAEMAVPVRGELVAQVLDDSQRLFAGATRLLAQSRMRLEGLARGIGRPEAVVAEKTQRLDVWSERLGLAIQGRIGRRRDRLDRMVPAHPAAQIRAAGQTLGSLASRLSPAAGRLLRDRRTALASVPDPLRTLAEIVRRARQRTESAGRLIESYSYKSVLNRGFAVVRDAYGTPLTDAAALTPGLPLALEFRDGTALAVAKGLASGDAPAEGFESNDPSPSDPTKRGAGTAGRNTTAGVRPSPTTKQGSLF